MALILGIESSCDESALALWRPQGSPKDALVGEWVRAKLEAHEQYGGVVPDIASREHLIGLRMLLEPIRPFLAEVKHIAVTRGPGLAPCLAMGISLARSLGLLQKIPVFGVNHLQGHAFSAFLPAFQVQSDYPHPRAFIATALPHLGLLVSGGNTLAFLITENYQFQVLGKTQDDAAGEALDKGARLLGFPYPGGPWIEKSAQQGDPHKYRFPQAFPAAQDLKFSFSGLKTSLRLCLEALPKEQAELPHLCASYQEAVVSALIRKFKQIAQSTPAKSLGLSGGVSQNTLLAQRFQALGQSLGLPSYLPHRQHSGDNATMIALAHAVVPELSTASPFSFAPALGLKG